MGKKSWRTNSRNDFHNEFKEQDSQEDLPLAYSQGNHTAYPTNIESAARYLTTQYPNIKSGNQQKSKQKKADDPKSEEKDNATTGTAGHTLRTVQQVKTTPLQAEKPT